MVLLSRAAMNLCDLWIKKSMFRNSTPKKAMLCSARQYAHFRASCAGNATPQIVESLDDFRYGANVDKALANNRI